MRRRCRAGSRARTHEAAEQFAELERQARELSAERLALHSRIERLSSELGASTSGA